MPNEIQREHIYHAESLALAGQFHLPLVQKIEPQAHARLSEQGGYLSEHLKEYSLEGVVSVRSAYTQVAGNRALKPGKGWATLTTSVAEGLNVLDVVTADRVVAQVATEHPLIGYVPSVTFLGTRFENLRIAGHPVKLDLDLNILGSKPENDAPYTSVPGLVRRAADQWERVRKHQSLPAELLERFSRVAASPGSPGSIECSLIDQAEGGYPGQSFGHVIDVPHFGKILLATLRIEESDIVPGTQTPRKTLISLTMIELKLGCIADADTAIVSTKTNGTTMP